MLVITGMKSAASVLCREQRRERNSRSTAWQKYLGLYTVELMLVCLAYRPVGTYAKLRINH